MRGRDLLEILERVIEIVVPELDVAELEIDFLPGHRSEPWKLFLFHRRDALDCADGPFLIAEITIHLCFFKQQEIVVRKSAQQVFEQGHRLPRFFLAAVKSAEQHLGIHAVVGSLACHFFYGVDPFVFFAMETNHVPKHFPLPRQAADDVIVQALNEARIVIRGLQLRHAIMILTRRGGVAQRIVPRFPHQKLVVGTQAVSGAAAVERPGIIGIACKPRIRQFDGAVHLVVESLLDLWARVQPLPSQKWIVSRYQLRLERAIAIHLPVEQGLGDVIVRPYSLRILLLGLFELG